MFGETEKVEGGYLGEGIRPAVLKSAIGWYSSLCAHFLEVRKKEEKNSIANRRN